MISIEDAKNVEFKKSVRGYNAEDVNNFVDEVVATLEQNKKEKVELVKKLDILAKRIEQYRQDEENGKVLSLPKSLLYIAGGLIAVIAGGNLVVDNACIIAESFGVSQNFIGLTIIAVGTSLPELVTSIVATRKGDSGLALGNAIGSNIFNILFILGISAAITPLAVLSESVIDCILLLLSAILLYIFARSKKSMCRWEGCLLYTSPSPRDS